MMNNPFVIAPFMTILQTGAFEHRIGMRSVAERLARSQ